MVRCNCVVTMSLLVFGLAGQSLAQGAPENHGKFGTWYRSSRVALPEEQDREEGVPQLELAGDAPAPHNELQDLLRPKGVVTKVSYHGYRSVQVNVDAQGRNIVGDAANEPSLVADPRNPARFTVGWRQFDSVSSNFRQAGNAYSNDGGRTWHNNDVLTRGTFRSDPVLGADSQGKFYYNSLQQTFYTDIFGSANRGASWSFLGPGAGGDKQWMTVDQTNSIGRGNLYELWSTAGNNYGGRQFSRSTNGGSTWMDPVFIPNFPVWGTLDVTTNGDLFLAGLGGNGFWVEGSHNAKDATQVPVFDLSTPVDLGGGLIYGSFVNPGGLAGQSWFGIDRSTGSTRGNMYLMASVGVDSANPCVVRFARSTDGGATWSSPTTVNDDAPDNQAMHWFGTFGIAPNGRIDAFWMDNRSAPTGTYSALFCRRSYDGGVTWTKGVQVSPTFNSLVGFPNQAKIGDYMTVASDRSGANIAYSATFNGEEDIWFLRVPAAAGIPVDAASVARVEGTSSSGTLPDIWATDGSTFDVGSAYVRQLGQSAAVQADFVLPDPNVGQLSVNLNASTTAATVEYVWAYNWQRSGYDFIQTAFLPAGQSVQTTVSVGSNASAYVRADGHVRIVTRALIPPRQNLIKPFRFRVDLLQIMIG